MVFLVSGAIFEVTPRASNRVKASTVHGILHVIVVVMYPSVLDFSMIVR